MKSLKILRILKPFLSACQLRKLWLLHVYKIINVNLMSYSSKLNTCASNDDVDCCEKLLAVECACLRGNLG